jgi:dCMP deaminase
MDANRVAEAMVRWGSALYSVMEFALGLNLEIEEEKMQLTKSTRPTFPELFRTIALTVATRSTCPRLAVGAVLVSESNHILATGYNGSPAGLPHCTEVGCLMPDSKPCGNCQGSGRVLTDYHKAEFMTCPECFGVGRVGSCKRTTHAEANALIQCALNEKSPKGATLICTHRPCVNCAGLLITAGIVRVEYAEAYGGDKAASDVLGMFAYAGVEVAQWLS